MSEQGPCFWGTSSNNNTTTMSSPSLAKFDVATSNTSTSVTPVADIHEIDDQLADILANENYVGDDLFLPNEDLFQVLSQLEIQTTLPSGSSDEDHHLVDINHYLPYKGEEFLNDANHVEKSKGKDVVTEADDDHTCSPSNDHDHRHRRHHHHHHQDHHHAKKKSMSKKLSSEQRRRRQINGKLQALQTLIPHSDLKRDQASILNDSAKHIKSLKHQIETMATWSDQRQLQQALYAPPTTYMPMMVRPNMQLGALSIPPHAVFGAQPMSQVPTMPYFYPPSTTTTTNNNTATCFSPAFSPWQYQSQRG